MPRSADQPPHINSLDDRSMELTKGAVRRVLSSMQPRRPGDRRRPREGGDGGVQDYLLVENVAGASWDSENLKRTPISSDCHPFKPHEDGEGTDKPDLDVTTSIKFTFVKEIEVTAGKGRIIKVIDGQCIGVDCDEISLPEEEEE